MKRIGPEHALQVAVAAYLAHALAGVAFWTSIDHAAAASKATGALCKQRGVKAGIPDIFILHAGRSVFIELKSDRGRVSEAQEALMREIEGQFGVVHVCRSVEAVASALEHEGVPVRARVAGCARRAA